jgi:TRAP-type C4-dicarboxylate transport system permease small subunit
LYLTTTVLFLILVINVFLRYLSGGSLRWAGEAPELLFPWLVFAGVVLAAQHGSHIGIVWLTEKFSPKVRYLSWIINSSILIVGYFILARATVDLLPITHEEHTPVLGVPSSVTYFAALLGFSCIALTAFTRLLKLLFDKEVSK